MYVTFSWPRSECLTQSEDWLVVPIADRLDLRGMLKGGRMDGEPLNEREVLCLEVSGLGRNFYAMPLMGIYNIPIWQKVEEVVEVLREFGVEPLVLINGNQSVLAYAGQEEARANYFRQALESAREALKATRRWFRDHRIAAIRQGIDYCLEHESSLAEFMGRGRTLVVTEKQTL